MPDKSNAERFLRNEIFNELNDKYGSLPEASRPTDEQFYQMLESEIIKRLPDFLKTDFGRLLMSKEEPKTVEFKKNETSSWKDLITGEFSDDPIWDKSKSTNIEGFATSILGGDSFAPISQRNSNFQINEYGEIIRPELGIIEAVEYMQAKNRNDFGEDYDKPKSM